MVEETHNPQPLLELHHISKRFGGVQALADVDLTVYRGSVHALVGENGAGKSTLGKVISGVIHPDSGEIRVNDRPIVFASPREALEAGIAMIQQEIALVPKLTVLKNVFLGLESQRSGVLQERETWRRFDELNHRSGFDLSADAITYTLSIADQKKVEVLKALARNAQLIVMDEPTATLSDEESAKLIDHSRPSPRRDDDHLYFPFPEGSAECRRYGERPAERAVDPYLSCQRRDS